MKKTYEKPVVSIDTEFAEGVYTASGEGSLTVSDDRVWDAWNGGGKRGLNVNWAGIDGTIVLTLNFNDTVEQINVEDSSVQQSVSGSTATLTFDNTAANPMLVGIHINHGTSIYNLSCIGYTYSTQ